MLKKRTITVLMVLLCLASSAFAQEQWDWKRISLLNCPRNNACPIRISDGKVLMVGGSGRSALGVYSSSSAEILDSVRGEWRFTSPMIVPRGGGNKMITLNDGRILLIGGLNSTDWTRSCEIFDPKTEKWTLADSMSFSRKRDITATKLQDGRVLITGGQTNSIVNGRYVNIKQCEIYDPATNKWKITDSMSAGRVDHSAVLLKDGRVLVAGGITNDTIPGRVCQIFDPKTEKWSSFPSMISDHNTFTLIVKEDSTVIAAGGGTSFVEIIKPGQSSWTRKPDLLMSISEYTPVIKANGNVIFCGGEIWSTYQEYDLTNYQPLYRKLIPDSVVYPMYVALGKGRILQAGGSKMIGDYVFYNITACYVYTNETVPVELTTFTGTASGGKVTLSWSTATETNNRGFEIERKTEEGSFNKIGYVQGNGTTTIPRQYSFTDNGISGQNICYRLKQVDYDGSYEFSKVVEINSGLPGEYSLEQNYPNPFNPATTIQYSVPQTARVSLTIYNMLGQVVSRLVNEEKPAGVYNVLYNAGNLSSGTYFYELRAGSFMQTRKFLLLK